MNISHLRYIIETADLGSISKAAKELFISQSHLSKIINEVESEFNIIIFARSNRGVSLTQDGKKFINYAKNVLNSYEDIMRLKLDKQRDRKELHISTVRSSLVMEVFLRFESHYANKKTNFTIKETDSLIPIKDVYYLKSDIGIINVEKKEKEEMLKSIRNYRLKYEKLCDLSQHIIVRCGHPLADKESIMSEDLYSYGLLRYDTRSLPYKEKVSLIDKYNEWLDMDRINHVIEVSDRGSYHNILKQTNYFAIGNQETLRQEEVFNLVSIPIKERVSIHNDIEMGLLYNRDLEMSEEAKRFKQMLMDTYK